MLKLCFHKGNRYCVQSSLNQAGKVYFTFTFLILTYRKDASSVHLWHYTHAQRCVLPQNDKLSMWMTSFYDRPWQHDIMWRLMGVSRLIVWRQKNLNYLFIHFFLLHFFFHTMREKKIQHCPMIYEISGNIREVGLQDQESIFVLKFHKD